MVVPPLPSQIAVLQSPVVCVAITVPLIAWEKPHTPAMHVRVLHSVSTPGHIVGLVQPPPVLVLEVVELVELVVELVVLLVLDVVELVVLLVVELVDVVLIPVDVVSVELEVLADVEPPAPPPPTRFGP